MRSVNFAWGKSSLIVEEHREYGLRLSQYDAGQLLAKLESIIGNARREFVDFLNTTVPEKDVSVMIINGERFVIYGINEMQISIIDRDYIVAMCGDMPSNVARIIRNESGKKMIVLV